MEIKRDFEHIRAGDDEIRQYRNNLEDLLPQRKPFLARWWPAIATPVLAAAVWFFFFQTTPIPVFEYPDELQEYAQQHTDPDGLLAKATRWETDGSPQQRLDALFIRGVLSEESDTVRLATRGLITDPRPSYRLFYLEVLLDHADGYQFHADELEARMEQETDRDCLNLYGKLLDLSVAG